MTPLSDQIRAVERELALRRNVYAYRVREGKMKQEHADKEIALMKAVLVTLVDLLASSRVPGQICDLVEDRERALTDEADKVEYISQVLGGIAGISAAAIGVKVTIGLLDQCKQAATEAAAGFKARAH